MTARPGAPSLFLVLAVLCLAWPRPGAAGGCVQIGPSIYCGTEGAHTVVGRSAIFRTGPPGEVVGTFLFLDRPGRSKLGQVLPRLPLAHAPPADPLPQAAPPGSYIDLRRGRDFGAFEFPFDNPRGGSIAGSRAGRLGPSLPPLNR